MKEVSRGWEERLRRKEAAGLDSQQSREQLLQQVCPWFCVAPQVSPDKPQLL